ncbi:unnamed protein product [Penicillium salamii]|uniref:DUF7779 domain-containing protein n=1 Tax=Penicillium salamii TaxID=1612424 RepID=A0A9W4MY07_9EURO|nr:unnamed protein product [Penicillium salamii]
MASNRSHVFRVTGLSGKLLDEDLKTALHEALNDNFADDERSHFKAEITIVPSCYESDTQRAALVQFRGGVPQFLRELRVDPLGDWQVEMGDDDINFDCHFFGFTQLYAPDENKPVIADIIAIAGLDGHAYGSWQGRGNLGRMWLRDFLSKDLPQCRTMIYGYNSKLSSHGVDTILDYGRELMEEIKKIRNTKECLVKAIQTMEEDHSAITSLHRATYGMILFAIPHKGLVMDDIQRMLAGDQSHPRGQLLQQISSKSDILINQLADFKNLIRDRKVVSFYETDQTRQLVLDPESGRWKRTGDFVTTVGADSALLQLPDHIEDKVPLHADHSMVVKFDSRNAAGYRTALDKLQQFSKEAPSVVAARFTQTHQKPQPCSTVPFKKDPMFVGREVVISSIMENHGAIGQHHERVALVGLAGVGKTQTAIEYSYHVRESTQDTWVFWIHASNRARLEQSYQQIAEVAEIPGRNDPKTNILQIVYQWLCDPGNGRWLMVLDNADNDGIFFNGNESDKRGPLGNFLPQASHGSMLITSRNGRAARNLVGSDGHVIEVQPMNEEESLALLRARFPASQSGEDEKALVQALDYVPLAITQAAAYISSRLPLLTVSAYLRLFHESESKQTRLLHNEDSTDLRRDPSIRYAVIRTWQLSFEQIRQERPAATDLLALMSMFDRQGIPEDLVCDQDQDILDFHDALAPLLSYSLIRLEMNERLFNMHRLVQVSVRAWLRVNCQFDRWSNVACQKLSASFPTPDPENRSKWRKLFPHAQYVLFDDLAGQTSTFGRALSLNFAYCLHEDGRYKEAEPLLLEELDRCSDTQNAKTSRCKTVLARNYIYQGNFGEAGPVYQNLLQMAGELHGPKSTEFLDATANLAAYYAQVSDWDEAEKQFINVKVLLMNCPQKENPVIWRIRSNLAWFFLERGQWKDSEKTFREVVESRSKRLGPTHPDTMTSKAGEATAVLYQGRHEEACAMLIDLESIMKSQLGDDHRLTIHIMSKVALAFQLCGKPKDAAKRIKKVIELAEKNLNDKSPATKSYKGTLASVYLDLGQPEKAEQLTEEVLSDMNGRDGNKDSESPDILSYKATLSLAYSAQGKLEQAETLGKHVLETRMRVLGEIHPDSLRSMADMADLYGRLGKQRLNEDLLAQISTFKRSIVRDEHSNAWESITCLDFTRECKTANLEEKKNIQELRILHAGLNKVVAGFVVLLAVTFFFLFKQREKEHA